MKGLLSVSFGTSHADTRAKTIDAIDADLAAAFSGRAIYTAWTSSRIIRKTTDRKEHHDTVDQALERMTRDGVDDLVVATSCLMEGGEMAKVRRAVGAWAHDAGRTARVAAPLLSSADDQRRVAQAICEEFASVPAGDALILMGHGSERGLKNYESQGNPNEVYSGVQDALHALGRPCFFVATAEGTPTFDEALELVKANDAHNVWLAPLMIVAGDHAKNDLAGEGGDSWARRVEANGMRAQVVLKGLGEYARIRQLVCDHARACLRLRAT